MRVTTSFGMKICGIIVLAVLLFSPPGSGEGEVELVISSPVIPLPVLQSYEVSRVEVPSEKKAQAVCGNGLKEDTEECEFDFNCSANYACSRNCVCEREETKPAVCGNGIVELGETCEFDDQCGGSGVCQSCTRCQAEPSCTNYEVSISGGGTLNAGQSGSVTASTQCTSMGPSSEAEREDSLIDSLLGVKKAWAAPEDEYRFGSYIEGERYGISKLKRAVNDCTKESHTFSASRTDIFSLSPSGSSATVTCSDNTPLGARVDITVSATGDCSGKPSQAAQFTCVGKPAKVCGNGVLDEGEQCDDNNTTGGDGCSASCQNEVFGAQCGNNRIEQEEECDPPGPACDEYCRSIVCGDGRINGSEQCDDKNTKDGDGCSSSCQIEKIVEVCGNNKREGSEECDGTATPSRQTCSAQCKIVPTCSNGILEGSEQCDDGNVVNNDQCDNSCKTKNTLEDIHCDSEYACYLSGQAMNGYSGSCPTETLTCPQGTTLNCQGVGSCTGLDQSCSGACCKCTPVVVDPPRCGDGKVDSQLNEACDDGNANNCDGCNNNCTVSVSTGCNLTCEQGNKEFKAVCQGSWILNSSQQCVCSNCVTQACFTG